MTVYAYDDDDKADRDDDIAAIKRRWSELKGELAILEGRVQGAYIEMEVLKQEASAYHLDLD